MAKPRLLDLFAGAGGSARGYQLAGFHVTGVDTVDQPRYAGDEFIQADALETLAFVNRGRRYGWAGTDYDAIHASPPCQAYSIATQRGKLRDYPDLLGPTRTLLAASGLPWVIENVPGAPMRPDFKLCGCRFGLELRRERWFETSGWHAFEFSPPHYHPHPVVSVVGHGTPAWVREQLGYNPTIAQYRAAMGIDWMNRNELSQAIPPAYTEYVGAQLLAVLDSVGP